MRGPGFAAFPYLVFRSRPAMSNRIDPSLLTPQILLRAYSIGLFPMAEKATDAHLFWVDPEKRGIFPLDRLVVARSLAKTIRSDRFEIRIDHDFGQVIDACAGAGIDRPETWINQRIRQLFMALHEMGQAHSVEVWRAGMLVGGLYGLTLGAAFFGESMFHRQTDASKVALVHLAARLRAGRYTLLDTQFLTPHLASLGAIEISRAQYRRLLASALEKTGDRSTFAAQPGWSGAQALQWVRPASGY